MWREGGFPLREVVNGAPVDGSVPRLKVVDISGWEFFSPDAICHFTIGVLWKSSVWPTAEVQRIELGPYQERLRKYLLSPLEVPLPDRLTVHIGIALEGSVGERYASMPTTRRGADFCHWFRIPGIEFSVRISPPTDDRNHWFDVRRGIVSRFNWDREVRDAFGP